MLLTRFGLTLALAKSSNNADVIHFFLGENPQLLKKQGALGKHKRNHSSCIMLQMKGDVGGGGVECVEESKTELL